jgi:hypothetical protein
MQPTHARASTLDLPAIAERLGALQRMAARLIPNRRDPEKFHVEKSELVHGIRAVRRALAPR